MADELKIPMREVNANLKGVPAYDGVAYGISVVDPDGALANILVVGPTAEAVASAIHAAWPTQPVAMVKMSKVIVMSATTVADEEL